MPDVSNSAYSGSAQRQGTKNVNHDVKVSFKYKGNRKLPFYPECGLYRYHYTD